MSDIIETLDITLDTNTKLQKGVRLNTYNTYCDKDIVVFSPNAVIPTDTLSITTNGTHNVKEYLNVNVNVPIPDGYIKPQGTLDITHNTEEGQTIDVTTYASVTVNVPIPDGYILPNFQTKTITPTTSSQTITFDSSYNGLAKVIVNATPLETKTITPTEETQTITPSNSNLGFSQVVVNGVALEEKGTIVPKTSAQTITPSGSYLGIKSLTIGAATLQNLGTITPTKSTQSFTPTNNYYGIGSFTIGAIPDEYIIPNLQAKSVKPTSSQQTITPDSGYDGLSRVTVSAVSLQSLGTITPTKSIQTFNFSSAYNGYNGFSVGAIPSQYIIPTGQKSITENGEYNVTNYATVNVNIESGANLPDTLTATANYEVWTLMGSSGSNTVQVPIPDNDDNYTYMLKSVTINTGFGGVSSSSYNAATGKVTVNITSVQDTTGYLTVVWEKVDWFKRLMNGDSIDIYAAQLEGITTIPRYSFYYYDSAIRIRFPSTLTTINASAFRSSGLNLVVFSTSASSVSIGDYAFNTTDITSVSIPKNVTSIGGYAFGGCSSLTTATLNCPTIGRYMFQNDYALSRVTMNSTVTSISEYAFSNCSALTSVTVPSSVTTIGNRIFTTCTKLTTATINARITSGNGTGMFYGCTKLTKVTYNANVEYVGTYTYYNCKALQVVDFRKNTSVPTLASTNILYSAPSTCKIVVPDSLYNSWITATNWSYSTIVSKIVKASEYTG